MASPEPAAVKRARAASGKAMLAVEAAAVVLLRSTVRRVVLAPAPSTPAAIVDTAHRIETAVAADVLRARSASRRESRKTFDVEMVAAVGAAASIAVDRRANDISMSAQVGKSYSAAWLSRAIAADRATVRDSMLQAADDTDYRIKAIGVSEVSSSFSDERERIGAAYAQRQRSRLAAVPLKLWWAHLDRACPRCRDLNGTIRPFGVNFPGGAVPGGIHANCRCYESVTAVGFSVELEEAQEAA